jgi:hypothetical protein
LGSASAGGAAEAVGSGVAEPRFTKTTAAAAAPASKSPPSTSATLSPPPFFWVPVAAQGALVDATWPLGGIDSSMACVETLSPAA